MTTLNIGILAHVDAGKTSLTERLLHRAGVLDTLGSVDDGSTRTDSLALERRRGITIKAAVASFPAGEMTINLIDTPGHPDFVAEVERTLGVLDGAVLLVSAVEGVQARTRVLMRTLARLRIPTLLFVNKIDRGGARPEAVLDAIAARLSPATVAMGTVTGAGTRAATVRPAFDPRLGEVLAENDDALLGGYLDGTLTEPRLRAALAEQTAAARAFPVFLGSAITGAGVDELVEGITTLLPPAPADPDGPLSGLVFAVDRDAAGTKASWVRLFSGTVAVRDRVPIGGGREARVTGIDVAGGDVAGGDVAGGVVAGGVVAGRGPLVAGRVGRLHGLAEARIGDPVGALPPRATGLQFAPPSLEAVVVPRCEAERPALHAALTLLAEQDPLIDLRQDDRRRELSVSLYGEVQKEVIAATLAEEHGVAVTFRETTTICVERPSGTGAAVEYIDVAPNPYLATVGLRVDPAPEESGVRYATEIETGALPSAFRAAVEETVHRALRAGGPHGWRVTDVAVTLTHSGYWARQSHAHGTFDKSMSSTAGDFRNLTARVLAEALRRAGTVVLEPVHRFRIELPPDCLGPLLPVLARLHAVPDPPQVGPSVTVLEGTVPAGRLHELGRLLPGLTRGEGVCESAFERYEPARGVTPRRGAPPGTSRPASPAAGAR